MLEIDKFIIKDVRCFKDKQKFNIRPLTFLVGENSTGKSTVLGCFQAMAEYLVESTFLSRGKSSINLNSDPFQMGSFENIVRRTRPKNEKFELGFEFIPERNNALKFELLVTFAEQANSANPITEKVRFIFDDGEIIFLKTNNTISNETSEIKIEKRNSKKNFTILIEENQYHLFFYEMIREILYYTHYYKISFFSEKEEKLSSLKKQLVEFLKDKGVDKSLNCYFRCFPFAPTRSEPRRTYEPWYDIPSSFGDEIPVRLRDLSIKKSETWHKLYKKLKDFGTKSGMLL